MSIDSLYQQAVSAEADRLASLRPCELMQVEAKSWTVQIDATDIRLLRTVQDLGDVRHIGIIADVPLLLGVSGRRFTAGMTVHLSARRLSGLEADALFY